MTVVLIICLVMMPKYRLLVLIGTVSFSDDPERLYEVLVCLVNSPFSFYVQIRDDNQVR